MAGPTDLGEWAGLFRALSASMKEQAPALASVYAELRGDAANPSAIADGHLLGAGATSNLLRRLAVRRPKDVRRAKPDRMSRPTFLVRTPLRDRIARPGTTIEALLAKGASPVSLLDTSDVERTPSLAFTDATAPAIAMNLALSEVFVEDRAPVLFVENEAWVGVLERALAPLVEKKLASVRHGSIDQAVEAGRSEGATRVVGVTSEKGLAKLEGVRGETVSGFATDVPSTFAIAPFPYDRSEVLRMARLAAAELLAPPCGTWGVDVVVSRTWIQRPLFVELLKEALTESGAAGRVRVVRTEGPLLELGEPGIAMHEVDSDYVTEFFELAAKHIEGEHEAPRASRWLVTAFAHPMELERPSFENELEAFLGGLSATTIGINARASLLYLDGALPIGRRGKTVQNALGLRGVDRALIEAPLRWSACEAGAWGSARARYETSPTLGRAVGLGARAFFS